MKYGFSLLFFATLPLFSISIEEKLSAELTLGRYAQAKQGALSILKEDPNKQVALYALIEALSASGDTLGAYTAWKGAESLSKEKKLQESLAFGVLVKGFNSRLLDVRRNALIGSALTADARSIVILKKALKDSNSSIRALAAHLASGFADAKIRDELLLMLKNESVWYVRMEVIRSLGRLSEKRAQKELLAIIGDKKTLVEERAEAMIALVSLYDHVDTADILFFAKSERAPLRDLSIALITYFDKKECASVLGSLCKDTSQSVRINALNALALLNVEQIGDVATLDFIQPFLADSDPHVAITASFLSLIQGKSSHFLEKWLSHPDEQLQREAAAALKMAGALKQMDGLEDPFIALSTAIQFIEQRTQEKVGAQRILQLLKEKEGSLWVQKRGVNPLFSWIEKSPSSLSKDADASVLLYLYSLVGAVDPEKARFLVRDFLLKKQRWEISRQAASLLISLGDSKTALELLEDKDPTVRMALALALALSGKEKRFTKVLMDCYDKVDRDGKIEVLEALSQIHDPDVAYFLTEKLTEPFEFIRVIASCALVRSLNN